MTKLLKAPSQSGLDTRPHLRSRAGAQTCSLLIVDGLDGIDSFFLGLEVDAIQCQMGMGES